MEWIDGLNLKKILNHLNRLRERLSIPEIVYIVAEASKGLSHAHELTDPAGQPLNIVHRDVKMANILLKSKTRACIADFGLAASINDEVQMSRRCGTPGHRNSPTDPQGLIPRDMKNK